MQQISPKRQENGVSARINLGYSIGPAAMTYAPYSCIAFVIFFRIYYFPVFYSNTDDRTEWITNSILLLVYFSNPIMPVRFTGGNLGSGKGSSIIIYTAVKVCLLKIHSIIG